MLKAIIIACAFCAGAGSAAIWLEHDRSSAKAPAMTSSMPSMTEMHGNAHLENLPVQEVHDPF